MRTSFVTSLELCSAATAPRSTPAKRTTGLPPRRFRGRGRAGNAQLPDRPCRGLSSLLQAVIDRGKKPTGRGFIGGCNQHAYTFYLQLRVLSSGIICRHSRSQTVATQHADDQLRLCAAGNDRHRRRRALHDLNSSARYYRLQAGTGFMVALWAARRTRGNLTPNQSADPHGCCYFTKKTLVPRCAPCRQSSMVHPAQPLTRGSSPAGRSPSPSKQTLLPRPNMGFRLSFD
jgi:hypothetical protein